jgi:2-phosphosulfolactate phosphatase
MLRAGGTGKSAALSMDFRRLNLETCGGAPGIIVVIDVLRAFSTACYAFKRGAAKIIVTDSVEGAFTLRERFPGSLIMGERGGYPVPGFDFSNSPVEISRCDLSGATMIQRTSAGTQGLVLCKNASRVLAASFCNASATARRLRDAEIVSFVITGSDEDAACADLLESRLKGGEPSFQGYAKRVRASQAAHKFLDSTNADFSSDDLDMCLNLDAVDFSLELKSWNDLPVLRRGS